MEKSKKISPDSDPIIIGYGNTYHEPAIAIVDGYDLFAEGIERKSQNKRAFFLPAVSSTVQHMMRTLFPPGKPSLAKKEAVLRTSWRFSPADSFRMLRFRFFRWIRQLWNQKISRNDILDNLLQREMNSQIPYLRSLALSRNYLSKYFEPYQAKLSIRKTAHHLAHAANAVYTSPFKDCAVMVLDGHGESQSLSFYHFEGGRFRELSGKNRGSIGLLYMLVTSLCGFDPAGGEEWKVMGLAPYGLYQSDIYNFFRDRTEVKGHSLRIGPVTNEDLKKLDGLVGGFRNPDDPLYMRSANLAFNFQKYFTDVVGQLTRNVWRVGLSENLATAGGCALNSSTNGQLLKLSGFKALHVPSAPADDGNALGAALYEKYAIRGTPRVPELLTPYLGTEINLNHLQSLLEHSLFSHRVLHPEERLIDEVASLLAAGKIVGWMQGRAEFGPRALGNRSILADPRDAAVKERINAVVKFREPFRPFAPSILPECGPDYFEDYQRSPYMERTLTFRNEVQDKMPAVVHVDGTGRLQTIDPAWNPLFFQLVSAFHGKTGIPLVLNTSLNIMGKPIVHSAEDAITLFATTGLDCLVIGNRILSKEKTG